MPQSVVSISSAPIACCLRRTRRSIRRRDRCTSARRSASSIACPSRLTTASEYTGATPSSCLSSAAKSRDHDLSRCEGPVMCDQDHYDDDLKTYSAKGAVSRRQFGALSLGAGMMALLPRAADAQAVTETDVKITTPDGVCDAYFVHPAKGTHAAVLVWPDI